MTAEPDFVIASWLDEGPTELPDDTRHSIATAARTMRQQRPGAAPMWRLDQMPPIARLALAAAGLAVAAVLAISAFRPTGDRVGGPVVTPTPIPTPIPTSTWPPSVVPLGTIALSDGACGPFGFVDNVGPGTLGTSIQLVNMTGGHATFGWYRLNDGRTWDEALGWVDAANAAIANGTGLPAADFVTEQERWEVEAGHSDYLIVPVGATPGTHGMLCTAGDPPPGELDAIYLVGPLMVE